MPVDFPRITEDGWHIRPALASGTWALLLENHVTGIYERYSGDYSTKVPPLPIPNREVKLRHADGTAQVGE